MITHHHWAPSRTPLYNSSLTFDPLAFAFALALALRFSPDILNFTQILSIVVYILQGHKSIPKKSEKGYQTVWMSPEFVPKIQTLFSLSIQLTIPWGSYKYHFHYYTQAYPSNKLKQETRHQKSHCTWVEVQLIIMSAICPPELRILYI